MKNNGNISYVLNTTKDMELVICKHSHLSYPIHNHVSVYTVGQIMDGIIEVTINNEVQRYKKGDIFAIPPYCPHSIQAIEEYSMLSLCISRKMVENTEFRYIQKSIMEMLNYAMSSDVIKSDEIYWEKILDSLYQIGLDKNVMAERVNDNINNVRKKLEAFPEEKISVDEMAQSAFSSKYHFIRNFKQEVGLTPHQFQIQNRIRKAQKLLQQTENITEVALDTGFRDQSHFIRHFEKIVRLTPTKYMLSCNILGTEKIR